MMKLAVSAIALEGLLLMVTSVVGRCWPDLGTKKTDVNWLKMSLTN